MQSCPIYSIILFWSAICFHSFWESFAIRIITFLWISSFQSYPFVIFRRMWLVFTDRRVHKGTFLGRRRRVDIIRQQNKRKHWCFSFSSSKMGFCFVYKYVPKGLVHKHVHTTARILFFCLWCIALGSIDMIKRNKQDCARRVVVELPICLFFFCGIPHVFTLSVSWAENSANIDPISLDCSSIMVGNGTLISLV